METQLRPSPRRLWALLLCLGAQVWCQPCRQPCQCPGPVPVCPEGVPLVLDGCRCCQVCARQKGASCSGSLPCDSQRGLECDYSASFPGGPGECISADELGCDLNGVSYQEGQVFQPSCAVQCRCAGGGVTCVPLCSEDVRLPSADCPNPQRVLLPGRCCQEWVCENMANALPQDPGTAAASDRLLPVLPGYQGTPPTSNCVEQSTQWSACSRTCGSGISTRVSNQNPACRLETQTRLCIVRPCHSYPLRPPPWRRGCERSQRPAVPVRLIHNGCYSVRLHRPRYCGSCTDGRCCTPYRTRTAPVAFLCPGGQLQRHAVMVISSCVCHYHCPNPYSAPSALAYRRAALWG